MARLISICSIRDDSWTEGPSLARHRKADPSPLPIGMHTSPRGASAPFTLGATGPQPSGVARAAGRHRMPPSPEAVVRSIRPATSVPPRASHARSGGAPGTSSSSYLPRDGRPYTSRSHDVWPRAARFDHRGFGPPRTPRTVDLGRNPGPQRLLLHGSGRPVSIAKAVSKFDLLFSTCSTTRRSRAHQPGRRPLPG